MIQHVGEYIPAPWLASGYYVLFVHFRSVKTCPCPPMFWQIYDIYIYVCRYICSDFTYIKYCVYIYIYIHIIFYKPSALAEASTHKFPPTWHVRSTPSVVTEKSGYSYTKSAEDAKDRVELGRSAMGKPSEAVAFCVFKNVWLNMMMKSYVIYDICTEMPPNLGYLFTGKVMIHHSVSHMILWFTRGFSGTLFDTSINGLT